MKILRSEQCNKYKSLVALFIPGSMFLLLLFTYERLGWYPWIRTPTSWPIEIWIMGFAGTIATIAGVKDWKYHLKMNIKMSNKEKNAEFIALAFGGIPLFILMNGASITKNNIHFLIPILIVVIFTVIMICYDEFIFHRRCNRYETLLHRTLVFGNGIAWMAWFHLCFIRGGFNAIA